MSSASRSPMRRRTAPVAVDGTPVTSAGTMSPAMIGFVHWSARERLELLAVSDDVAQRSAVLRVTLVEPPQAAIERTIGGRLQVVVERRLYGEARLVQI